ncbi:MAG: alpha-L-fucosidase [Clostridia bacterium]|nr:alpha-L-fucosidase [Clostridia bacterium]
MMINKEEWFGTEMDLEVEGQHNSLILIHPEVRDDLKSNHPDAQWFKNAGLGLFLHWGISAVDGRSDISWGMLSYGEYAKADGYEDGTIGEDDDGTVLSTDFKLKPSRYFDLAKKFDAKSYNPDKWIKIAKKAGFQYAVLTAKHCDGFMLWPSEFGDFSTKMYLNGRDLVREFVDACRKYDMKVGLYFTPTDWYFNRKHMSFMHYMAKRKNPNLPEVDENFLPINLPSDAEMDKQKKIHGLMHRAQLHELLTNYGKIDVLWFDGAAHKGEVYPLKEIYKLQPGAVATTRMHGYGDFKNCEVKFADQQPKGWWEYCTIWSKRQAWAYTNNTEYRPTAEVITELIKTRNWGGNYLLNIGPMAGGDFPEAAVYGLEELTKWMEINKESVLYTDPLPVGETSNVYATAGKNARYLFIIPGHPENAELSGIKKPLEIKCLGSDKQLHCSYTDDILKINLDNIGAGDDIKVIKIIL